MSFLSFSPRLRSLLISLAITAALMIYAALSAEPVLRASLLPDDSPIVLRRKFKPLSEYLEKKIGMKVEFRPVSDADSLVDALAANKLDIAWFSGYDLARAKLRSKDKVIPIVQRAEDAQSRSVFITRRPDIAKLDDLAGKTFAFGSPSSVSGHLMPRAFLRAAFVDPDIEMKQIIYSATPEAVFEAVSNGQADAGCMNIDAWEKLIAEGRVATNRLHVFFTTPPFHDRNWAVRADMDDNLRQKLADAFLSLDRNIGLDREILDLQQGSRFIPADSAQFEVIETAARSAGLLKE